MALPAQQPHIDACTACGKLFPRTSMPLCAQCSLVDENRFQVVRAFLIANDGASVGDIARGTGVSGSDVRAFVDGGRLVEVTSGMAGCTCGGVGQRCKYCRSRLSSTFREMESTMSREIAERGEARPAASPGFGGRGTGKGASGAGRDADGGQGRTSYVRRIRRIGDIE